MLFLVAGCQSWRFQDVESLPPTASLPQTSQEGVVHALYWDGVAGTDISSLTSLPAYPKSPDAMLELNELRGPANRGDNYGTLVRGYIIPPESGEYRFFLSGDDETRLSLGTSENINTTSVIASVPGYTSPGSYTKYSSQTSAPQQLSAGQRYYFEILHKEGGGGDHFSVAWEGPGLTQQVISAPYIASLGQSLYPDVPEIRTAYSLGYRVGFTDGAQGLTFDPDYPPLDADQDGLYDNWEIIHGLSASDPADAMSDPDQDLLSAADEFLMGTSENNPDTDGDGIPDGVEFAYGLNPLRSIDATMDSDNDGYTNLEEYQAGTAMDDPNETPYREPVYVPGFVGQYYSGMAFDSFVTARDDGAIDFSWGSGTPLPELPVDGFSVRWSGLLLPPHTEGSQDYRFTTRTDDGVRLYLDGQLVIDRWRDQSPTSYSATASLPAQQPVPVTMEYYENRGGAVAQLSITDVATGQAVSQLQAVQAPAPTDMHEQDTDADGIPDTWELRNGLNPWVNDSGTIHNDGGITSLQAYELGVSPWTLESVTTEGMAPDGTTTETAPAPNGGITLSWTAPSTRVDGSSIALSEIDFYEISYGQEPDKLTQIVQVPGDLDSYRFTDLAPGTWYFSIRVVDTQGRSSSTSNIVQAEVP
ncbi:PA14 domain-containing protein [Marinobacter sp.]|uniref:PA14 domain-containing protein n=1 Tax=Marinobacter sp. TaxID=50741 RepID=UPI00299F4670|nr:PA14 domain-containing protein [Marinobacter sp.]